MNQTAVPPVRGVQALVVMVLAMLTIVAGLGLIIDGGNAWAQQRITQAGNDAASEAGAMVLAQNLAGATTPAGGWDGAVNTAVTGAASNNGAAVDVAYYTDICGTLLRSDGTKAAGPGDAAVVGAGVLPTNNNTNPDCPAGVVGPVAGVQVAASRQFSTFVSGVIGITGLTASTTATAVSGLLQGSCAAESGCIVLPITVPVTVVDVRRQRRRRAQGPDTVAQEHAESSSRCARTTRATWAGWTGRPRAVAPPSWSRPSSTRTTRRSTCRPGTT